jgi:phage gpG-like protein
MSENLRKDIARINSISRGSWLTGGGGKPTESSQHTSQIPQKNYLTLQPLPKDDLEEAQMKAKKNTNSPS